jgi:ribose transport system substrate-binding protein
MGFLGIRLAVGRSRAMGLTLGVLLIAVLVSACGSSGGGSSSSATGPAAEESSSGSKGVEEATAAIAPFEKAPTSIGVTEPIKKVPAGATFAYVECELPQCTVIGEYMKPAAEAMGVNLEIINAGATPESYQRGFTIALQKEPDAIIVPALDPVLYPEQMKQIREQEIPFIIWSVPEEAGNGITTNLVSGAEYERNGRLMADYVVSKSQGEGKALYVDVPDFTVFKSQKTGFEDEISKKCPNCESETLSVTVQELGKGLPGRVVSYLQQHPETTSVVGAFGNVLTGVPEALQAAGISGIETLTQAGPPETMQYIKEGKQTADLSLNIPVLGWKAIDAAGRAVAGQSVSADTETSVPIGFVTQEDITFNPEEGWQTLPHFEEEFEQLWEGR